MWPMIDEHRNENKTSTRQKIQGETYRMSQHVAQVLASGGGATLGTLGNMTPARAALMRATGSAPVVEPNVPAIDGLTMVNSSGDDSDSSDDGSSSGDGSDPSCSEAEKKPRANAAKEVNQSRSKSPQAKAAAALKAKAGAMTERRQPTPRKAKPAAEVESGTSSKIAVSRGADCSSMRDDSISFVAEHRRFRAQVQAKLVAGKDKDQLSYLPIDMGQLLRTKSFLEACTSKLYCFITSSSFSICPSAVKHGFCFCTRRSFTPLRFWLARTSRTEAILKRTNSVNSTKH